jgi:hypothetical protein
LHHEKEKLLKTPHKKYPILEGNDISIPYAGIFFYMDVEKE